MLAPRLGAAEYRTIGTVLQAIRATYDHTSDQSESQILSSLIGAFVTALQGQWVNPFGVMLHGGVVAYAWARRGHVFDVKG
ncbi:hypothetical protein [Pseudomonas chlororaphis]|uniref:hypothetical protein n=1 Tax=Pseudomonas chlororaphis TaxID=587753 RepID=UPI000F702222|nr:hypothetical protein C4K28_4083 [Pseudomonas chlororaphis subsp. piscium]